MFRKEFQTSINIESLTAMQHGWIFTSAQLGESVQPSDIVLIRSTNAGYNQFQFHTPLDQRVRVRPGNFSFGILELDSPRTLLGDRVFPTHALSVFPHDEEIGAVSRIGFHGNGMHFRESYLSKLALTVFRQPLENLVPAAGIYEINAIQGQHVRAELKKWRMAVTNEVAGRVTIVARREESLALAILNGLTNALPLINTSETDKRRVLSIALDYIHSNSLENISIAQLCNETGCSERWLGKCFRERFGVTPKSYIKHHRMALVRNNLVNFSSNDYESIVEIAADQGFWHMGQFAADYRSIYGELPSSTIKRVGCDL